MVSIGTTARAEAVEKSADVAGTCEKLRASLSLPETRLQQSSLVHGPAFTPPGATKSLSGLPAFCRVVGIVQPAITFEVWLPIEGWNGKFNGVGGGGLAGLISYDQMADALKRGYATASTDTGHVDGDLTWLQDEGRLVDYGHRAIHEMTLKSKAIVQKLYARPASRAYFTGCSTGGRQGLMEAERYPEDYNGILAGAPVNWLIEDILAQLWAARAALASAEAYVPPEKLPALAAAVLARCDNKDGAVDGVLENPLACDFDPGQMQCPAGKDSAACLTAPQVDTVRKIYAGPSRAGVRISAGPAFGSEPSWAPFIKGPNAFIIADTVARSLDPAFDPRSFDFDAMAERMSSRLARHWNATSGDLRAAARHGTKIIVYHGWSDAGIPPANTVRYYENATPSDSIRLFMVPGMDHCRGGPGVDKFEGLAALERWVERGVAPAQIIASRMNQGVVEKTRPLCPYPEVAVYDGKGDTKSAASFSCRKL